MSEGSSFVVTVPSGFEPEVKREIRSLIPDSKVRILFFKGNLLVRSSLEEAEAVKRLRDSETLYVGRVFPVSAKVAISPEKESILRLYGPLEGKLKPEDSFMVRCQRRGMHGFSSQDVERALGMKLEESSKATVDLKNPRKVVVVQIFQNTAYVGVTDSENLVVKPIRVSRKYAKGERPFTRAEHKIKEALEAFNVKVNSDYEVLDLGAAPGGWTKVFAGLAKRVVAVDPAALELEVEKLPNVVHLQCRAEEIPNDAGIFNLVTNDMNLAPAESAVTMVAVAPLLKKGGFAVMTVKFVTRDRRGHVEEALRVLEAQYSNFRVKRLPHNRLETTVFMQKK